LLLTALLSSLLGAVVAYFVLTVPNDLEAGALLRQARTDVQQGDREKARQSLGRVIQQYPRTDAAAAAAVALASLEADERQRLARKVDGMQRTLSVQTLRLDQVLQKLNAPPPAPQIVAAPPQPPPPPPVAAKKPAPAQRKPAHRAQHRRR
jgi:predicted negative regulator of RcsB-dependent stress response